MPPVLRLDALAAHFATHGPIADYSELVAVSSRGTVRAAVRAGLIARMGGGVYLLSEFARPRLGSACPSPSWVTREPPLHELGDAVSRASSQARASEEARLVTALFAVARGQHASLTLRSAAIAHGWPILINPDTVDLAVPPGRRTPAGNPDWVKRWVRRLAREEWSQYCTSPSTTVIDCARELPFREALAIADSALRSGKVGRLELREAGDRATGPGAPAVRRVVDLADGCRANPFESAVAAELEGVKGLDLVPQYVIEDRSDGFYARVDSADDRLRIVVEADSYEFHGGREQFRADRKRYVELTVRDWLVLPVTMPMVMNTPDWLRAQAERLVDLREFQARREALARRFEPSGQHKLESRSRDLRKRGGVPDLC